MPSNSAIADAVTKGNQGFGNFFLGNKAVQDQGTALEAGSGNYDMKLGQFISIRANYQGLTDTDPMLELARSIVSDDKNKRAAYSLGVPQQALEKNDTFAVFESLIMQLPKLIDQAQKAHMNLTDYIKKAGFQTNLSQDINPYHIGILARVLHNTSEKDRLSIIQNINKDAARDDIPPETIAKARLGKVQTDRLYYGMIVEGIKTTSNFQEDFAKNADILNNNIFGLAKKIDDLTNSLGGWGGELAILAAAFGLPFAGNIAAASANKLIPAAARATGKGFRMAGSGFKTAGATLKETTFSTARKASTKLSSLWEGMGEAMEANNTIGEKGVNATAQKTTQVLSKEATELAKETPKLSSLWKTIRKSAIISHTIEKVSPKIMARGALIGSQFTGIGEALDVLMALWPSSTAQNDTIPNPYHPHFYSPNDKDVSHILPPRSALPHVPQKDILQSEIQNFFPQQHQHFTIINHSGQDFSISCRQCSLPH